MARKARATAKLLEQVNKLAPKRSKSSDGWIGDPAHQATKSDHNPNKVGVVQAIDITHDPRNGFDSHAFADMLRTKKDRRIKYVISKRRIFSSTVSPWQWRRYTGKNPHDMHVHVSVADSPKLYDDESPWQIEGVGTPTEPDEASPETGLKLLKRGSRGEEVKVLQRILELVPVDGIFGPNTEAAVKKFQLDHSLDFDGRVGQYTWRELLKPATEELSPVKLPAPDPEHDKAWWDQFIEWATPKPGSQPEGEIKPEAKAEETFYPVIQGAFYSKDPYDKQVPTAIRTNNPGALNTSPNVNILPGYVGWDETSKGNKTAIFRSPEHGVAAWWDLLRRYRIAGAMTIQQIITRYGGGQDYSAYAKFVQGVTKLTPFHEIKIDGSDDENLLAFARAMFRYEGGVDTPLSDEQILKGFEMGRSRAATEVA